ncbi:MAG TPA: hypothetical protein PLK94_14470 [Alphaproteobacteria bacterium]|nr:hypothetical protein [Alphaproteobacteria bacterium]
MTANQVIKAYMRRGVEIGPFNLFGIRYSENQKADVFNDIIGCIADGILYYFDGTTDPGRRATENRSNGAAHLCLGYHPDIWHIGIHGKKNPAFAHEAFVQTAGPVTIWRDKNRNYEQDDFDMIEKGYFGINLHRASIHGSDVIGPYSEGCQVTSEPDSLEMLLNLAKESGEKKFSYMLFDKGEV